MAIGLCPPRQFLEILRWQCQPGRTNRHPGQHGQLHRRAFAFWIKKQRLRCSQSAWFSNSAL